MYILWPISNQISISECKQSTINNYALRPIAIYGIIFAYRAQKWNIILLGTSFCFSHYDLFADDVGVALPSLTSQSLGISSFFFFTSIISIVCSISFDHRHLTNWIRTFTYSLYNFFTNLSIDIARTFSVLSVEMNFLICKSYIFIIY